MVKTLRWRYLGGDRMAVSLGAKPNFIMLDRLYQVRVESGLAGAPAVLPKQI
jgi:hypothetical protein